MSDERARHDSGPTYEATLAPAERRLGSRVESFGDIVFGFAVSQCALQLPTVSGHATLGHPLSLFLYFGTYALLVSMWLTYHRMLSASYRATGLDLFLAFAYLALVSLLPYGMYGVTHEVQTLAVARTSVAVYTVLFSAAMGLASITLIRNLRRGWGFLTVDDRERTWRQLCIRVALFVGMMLALAVDLTAGPLAALPVSLSLPVFARIAAALAHRAPVRAWLHVAGGGDGDLQETAPGVPSGRAAAHAAHEP